MPSTAGATSVGNTISATEGSGRERVISPSWCGRQQRASDARGSIVPITIREEMPRGGTWSANIGRREM